MNGQLLKQFDTEIEFIFELTDLESGVYALKKLVSGQIQKWQKL